MFLAVGARAAIGLRGRAGVSAKAQPRRHADSADPEQGLAPAGQEIAPAELVGTRWRGKRSWGASAQEEEFAGVDQGPHQVADQDRLGG